MNASPALTGRPEIVDLANADRDAKLARLADQLRATAGSAPTELVDEMIDLYREVALRQTDAGWWLGDERGMFARTVAQLFTADDKARLGALAGKR